LRQTLQRGVYGQYQFVRGGMLQDESLCTSLQAAARIGRVLMHCQDDNLDMRILLPQQRDCINAVEMRHRHIDDDHIRLERLRRCYQGTPILDDSDKFEIVGEQAFQSFRDDSMIVSQ